jgi:hypothetical protein
MARSLLRPPSQPQISMSSLDIFELLPKNSPLNWIPFNAGHAMTLQIDPSIKETLPRNRPLAELIEAQANQGHAITAILQSKPVAIFGAIDVWDGVAEMWLNCEERLRTYGKTMTRAAQIYADYIVISRNLHRLQITVRCADLRAVRWGLALGFEIEGLMKKYGADGSDFFMMSRS